jgi:recombination protein RecT
MAEQSNGGGGGAVVEKESVAKTFRDQMGRMQGEFAAGLPPHMSVETFMRVVLTAVNDNPDLLFADRRSLLSASMRAAQDGLLPDGRDGALVVYNTKVPGKAGEKDKWIKKVQWMPMFGGLLKKARNSGEILAIEAHAVREGDRFLYVKGDNPRLEHEPNLEADEPGALRFAYAICWLKNGAIIREVMTRRQVMAVREVSKSKDSPAWKQWEEEMWRKAVFRRLFKWIPRSSSLEDAMRRDDENYSIGTDTEEHAALRAAKVGLFEPVHDPLSDIPEDEADGLARGDDGQVDPDTGEVAKVVQEADRTDADQRQAGATGGNEKRTDGPDSQGTGQKTVPAKEAAAPAAADKPKDPEKPKLEVNEVTIKEAKDKGIRGGKFGMPRSAVPKEYRVDGCEQLRDAWLEGFDEQIAREQAAKAAKAKPSDEGSPELGGI